METAELDIDWLTRHGQGHLAAHCERLDAVGKATLARQLDEVDLPLLQRLHASFGQPHQWAELAQRAAPPAAFRVQAESENPFSRAAARQRGQAALAAGDVAMILVAGGQGTRLGFAHPKGMLPVGPVSKRTLFQIHIDKLHAVAERFGKTVPLYVMTSPATHDETVQFLDAHDWFGYPEACRAIFCQGTMPAVDAENGQLLITDAGTLFQAPDGHGGMLAALARSGRLDALVERRIRHVFYCQIDNPLAQVCDPVTLGYHILAESEMSSQAIPKQDPLQKVGNLVSIDGKVHVIEYSDLPEDIACQTNSDGSLQLWAGSIAVHVFDVDFLVRASKKADALPFHLAHKKVPFRDDEGQFVEPEKPNALKFERFIFDLLPMARHSIVVEVDPKEAFSPVKNAPDQDFSTVATAQAAMAAQARRALLAIGVEIPTDALVEIGPSLLLNEAKLRQRAMEQVPITEPTYLK